MHSLAGVQQQVATAPSIKLPLSPASSSLLRRSGTELSQASPATPRTAVTIFDALHSSSAPATQLSSWFSSRSSSLSSSASLSCSLPTSVSWSFTASISSLPYLASAPGIWFRREGQRRLKKCSVIVSGKRIVAFYGLNGPSTDKGRMDFRGFASRKDRKVADESSLVPDIASLRRGFSKRFPNEKFSYSGDSESDSDHEDDGVEVKSFKSGNFGRARSSTLPRDGYSSRAENKSYGSSGPGGSVERDAYERRKGLGNARAVAGAQDTRYEREGRSEKDGSSYRSSGILERRARRTFRGREKRGREPYGGGVWTKDTPIFEDDGRKRKPAIDPVNFTSGMNKSPHVAILGGGMSGLMCALTLEEHGIQSTVFDTGKHGLGGRMGTRYVEEHEGEKLVFDHAAQFFTVTDARFQKKVDRWISEGTVKEWNGNVGILKAGGHFAVLPHATKYIATNGMRSLADSMLSQSKQINVRRPCWISSMEAADGRWNLMENRSLEGEFDLVVIAHNGKCANRLLSTAHVPRIVRQMRRLELSSIWALLAAFNEPIPVPRSELWDGAFVEGVDALSWMGNNSSKLGFPSGNTPECWTFFSTATYGKKNKVPQESIPSAKAQKVKNDMLHGVEIALGLSEGSLPIPVYTRLQLWGAALPMNTPGVPCIFDSQCRIGICGDWLLGSSLEAAALSGMALANHIAKYRDHGSEDGEEFSIGLQQTYTEVNGLDIGQFSDVSQEASSQEILVGV